MKFATFHDLEDQSIFITGGGAGIGADLTKGFLSQGSKVTFIQRSNPAKFLIECKGKYKHEPTFLECDVTNTKDLKAALQTTADKQGAISVLVNNAANDTRHTLGEFTSEQWDKTMNVNLKPHFFTAQEVAEGMKKNGGGSIVNISSVAGMRYVGKPQVGYSASKAALMQMTKTTAIIHAENKIRLNCVVPGLMHTPLVERLANKYADGKYDEFVKTRNNQVPMKKMGSSFDVANAVLFLASDEAKYITGTEIVVDGGLTATTP